MKSLAWMLGCMVCFVLGGFFWEWRHDENHNNVIDTVEMRSRDPGYKLINPLLECDDVELSSKASLINLKKKVLAYIEEEKRKGKTSHVSVYFRDLNDGPWMGIAEDEYFSPASLVKVPLMMAFFKLAEENPEVLNKKISYKPVADGLVQEIGPTQTLEAGSEYSIENLVYRMIAYSDNQAYNLLQAEMDNKFLIKVYADMGINVENLVGKLKENPAADSLTVKDNAAFYRILYNSSYLTRKYSEKALSILTESEFKEGFKSSVAKNVLVASKFGERTFKTSGEKQFHECGIFYDESPYMLCVMTRGESRKNLINAISQISKMVFEGER